MKRILHNLSGNFKVNIIDIWILKNFWEYFITDMEVEGLTNGDNRVYAIVFPDDPKHTELGFVDLDEIKPYLLLKGSPENAYPPPGWRW